MRLIKQAMTGCEVNLSYVNFSLSPQPKGLMQSVNVVDCLSEHVSGDEENLEKLPTCACTENLSVMIPVFLYIH